MKKILILSGLVAAATLSLWLLLSTADDGAGDGVVNSDRATRLAQGMTRAWRGNSDGAQALAELLPANHSAVYLAARRRGVRLAHAWGDGQAGFSFAVESVRSQLPNATDLANVDTLELVIASDFRNMDPRKRGWSSHIHRGVHGFELSFADKQERYSPSYMLATNRDTRRLMALFRQRHGLSEKQMLEDVRYRRFKAEQWLITLGDSPTAIQMERGNQFVPLAAVTQGSTLALAKEATGWMSRNLHEDGRMTYKFWPSARTESEGNNMIRQWMATLALIRAAKYWQDDSLMTRAAANIDYNLAQFYHEEKGFGLIEWQGKVKLGAVALAALALVEHPDMQRWAKQEAALRRTTDYLRREDGSFTTFFKPAGRNDVQNFYPGEALLYWAALYERDKDPQRLQHIMDAFAYYRDWHMQPRNRNPAFIPWHTQAYYKLWRLTEDAALRDFIFTMNDWLVDEMLQPLEQHIYRDTHGRFYNPQRPYGPPHVSSTGVYLEGLIDAFELARHVGDQQRVERYRRAIRLGLRSVMQLQFVDEVDMYYVPVPLRDRVRGGMRTTVYNNEIRCDNVQHNLMGILKIVDGFSQQDYIGSAP